MTRKEYNICVSELSDRVYGFALKNSGNTSDAKDIVQESFERLWVKHDKIAFDKAKSYLFSTAYHCMIDNHRKIKRMEYSNNMMEEIDPKQNELDNKQWLQEALNKMNEQEKSLILMRDYEGYSYEELGDLTGLSLSQVKVYLFRARKKFRNWLIELNKISNVI
ncbi:MAG: RNA polymerase sigma factor [Chitinophagales bacterium]